MTELKTILHVDDDEDILEIARMALTLVDSFDLHQFKTGTEALQAIETIQPDLLLLDVMMPNMSGPDVWKGAVAKLGRDIPTIFMTAKAEDEMSVELKTSGALEVITKPFDPITLGSQIRTVWASA
ncbi:response regulator [Rhodobacterales bacterium HKCCE4037]|nr:response regulator [Rhodobacterales bacterium HKCCE4037]